MAKRRWFMLAIVGLCTACLTLLAVPRDRTLQGAVVVDAAGRHQGGDESPPQSVRQFGETSWFDDNPPHILDLHFEPAVYVVDCDRVESAQWREEHPIRVVMRVEDRDGLEDIVEASELTLTASKDLAQERHSETLSMQQIEPGVYAFEFSLSLGGEWWLSPLFRLYERCGNLRTYTAEVAVRDRAGRRDTAKVQMDVRYGPVPEIILESPATDERTSMTPTFVWSIAGSEELLSQYDTQILVLEGRSEKRYVFGRDVESFTLPADEALVYGRDYRWHIRIGNGCVRNRCSVGSQPVQFTVAPMWADLTVDGTRVTYSEILNDDHKMAYWRVSEDGEVIAAGDDARERRVLDLAEPLFTGSAVSPGDYTVVLVNGDRPISNEVTVVVPQELSATLEAEGSTVYRSGIQGLRDETIVWLISNAPAGSELSLRATDQFFVDLTRHVPPGEYRVALAARKPGSDAATVISNEVVVTVNATEPTVEPPPEPTLEPTPVPEPAPAYRLPAEWTARVSEWSQWGVKEDVRGEATCALEQSASMGPAERYVTVYTDQTCSREDWNDSWSSVTDRVTGQTVDSTCDDCFSGFETPRPDATDAQSLVIAGREILAFPLFSERRCCDKQVNTDTRQGTWFKECRDTHWYDTISGKWVKQGWECDEYFTGTYNGQQVERDYYGGWSKGVRLVEETTYPIGVPPGGSTEPEAVNPNCSWASSLVGVWTFHRPDFTDYVIFDTLSTGHYYRIEANGNRINEQPFEWTCLEDGQFRNITSGSTYWISVDAETWFINGDSWHREQAEPTPLPTPETVPVGVHGRFSGDDISPQVREETTFVVSEEGIPQPSYEVAVDGIVVIAATTPDGQVQMGSTHPSIEVLSVSPGGTDLAMTLRGLSPGEYNFTFRARDTASPSDPWLPVTEFTLSVIE